MSVQVQIEEKAFQHDIDKKVVLDDIHLNIQKGNFLTIIGPSDCGKSTLLKIIAGLDTEYSGVVLINEKPVVKPAIAQGFIFQEHRLFPWMTVEQNIAADLSLKDPEVRRKVDEIIEIVRLKGFEKAYPSEISGGMSQRVAIARALIRDPEVLLLDEPFGALDAFTRQHLQDVLIDIWQKKKITMVLVTHDIDESIYLGTEIAVTADGYKANALLVNKDSGIKSVKDLKGKKIAVAKGSSAFGFLYLALEQEGIDPNEVEIIQLQPDEARPAFENGSVDVWSIWEPFISIQMIQNNAEILINGEDLGRSSASFAIARTGIIENNPKLVDIFLEVFARAAEWRMENKEEAITFFAELRGLDSEVVDSVLTNTNTFALPITEDFIAAQQTIADLLFELDAIDKEINTAEVVDNQFVEKLLVGE